MREIREISEIGEKEYCPLILPHHYLKLMKGEVSEEKLQALKDGKCVFIEGFWTVLSVYLPSNPKLNKK